jgi:hypothetical protein
MHTKRNALRLIAGGIALCAGARAGAQRAAPEITVYYSRD